MTNPARPRFSLRDLMVLVVLMAIPLAGELRGVIGQPGASVMIYYSLIQSGWLAIFFIHRNLSRWSWLIIASILIQPLSKLAGLEDWTVLSFPAGDGPSLLSLLIGSLPTLLYMLGLAMLLRDVRRQLLAYQAQIPSESPVPNPT